MINGIYDRYNQWIGQPCHSLWEKSFPIRYKVAKASQTVFDALLPRPSLSRYVLTDLSPKALKFGCLTVGLPTAVLGFFLATGHLIGSHFESGHGDYSAKEIMYDETLGILTLVPIGALGTHCFLIVMKNRKKAIPEMLTTTGATAAVASGIAANCAIGHYANASQYGEGPVNHYRFHDKAGLIYEFTMDSLAGLIPSALIVAVTTVSGSCLFLAACGLKDCMNSQIETYRKWKEK